MTDDVKQDFKDAQDIKKQKKEKVESGEELAVWKPGQGVIVMQEAKDGVRRTVQ